MKKIAIIEDDVLFNNALAASLEREGFSVATGFSCREGRKLIQVHPDLMLIDINLPDGEGISICEEARSYGEIPVIFLTARDEEVDIIKAFDAGCDDYIVKPFSINILMKRMHAVLRRNIEDKKVFLYKNLKIEFDKKQVSYDENNIKLTAKEYKLLEYLVRNKNQVLTRDMILQALWDVDEAFVDDNTLSVTINRLRRKIEPEPSNPIFVKNVFGIGYTFGE